MKTAVTVVKTEQISIDDYRDYKYTRVFDDSATILEIKQWMIVQLGIKAMVDEFSLSNGDISNIVE